MTQRRRRKLERPDRPEGFNQWQPETYQIAGLFGVIETVEGYTYRGLGIHLTNSFRAKYRRKDGTRKQYCCWSLTHLNTGHAADALFDKGPALAFAMATELAELIDWTFDGLEGWRNADPELPEKRRLWLNRHDLKPRGGRGGDDNVARAIGMARW